MQIYCIKINTLLEESERIYIIDDDSNNKKGATMILLNNIVQSMQRKYRCDVYIEDLNLIGEAVFISELRKENFDDER